MSVFFIKSMWPDVSLRQIYRSITAFLVAEILRLALFVRFPGIALWLVQLLT